MPTPLARLLRALGGGRLSPQALRRIPKCVLPCTDPEGPDFDLPLRWALDDLTPQELANYERHRAECEFCRQLCEQARSVDGSELRALAKNLFPDPTQPPNVT